MNKTVKSIFILFAGFLLLYFGTTKATHNNQKLYKKQKEKMECKKTEKIFEIYSNYLSQQCIPDWSDLDQKYISAEFFYQNFLDALPNKEIFKIKNFRYVKSIKSPKEIYQDDREVWWMIDFSPPPFNLEEYIISGLYKLVLGKYAPNEQLIKCGFNK